MRLLIIYGKGMLMGIADLVPGVSGGTVALITGLYRELIESIDNLKFSSFRVLFQQGIGPFWKNINGSFLTAIFGGILTSIMLFSRLIEYLIENETIRLWAFFFGLLIASIVYLIKKNRVFSPNHLGLLLLGIIISYSVTLITPTTVEANYLYLFFCGVIAISAMILPGLSGAYLLLILGTYKIILSNIRKAQDLIFSFDQQQFLEVVFTLGAFVLGIGIGIKLFSRILRWLFDKKPKQTLAVLIGLMTGALHKIWPWQMELSAASNDLTDHFQTQAVWPHQWEGDAQLWSALILFLLGFFLLFGLERLKSKTND